MRCNIEGDNANGRLPIFLRMSDVRGHIEAQAWRLLRLLLLRRRILPADSRRSARLLRDKALSFVLWRGCGYRRQRLDDPAIRNRAAATLIDHAVEFATQGAQVGNLSINLDPVLLGDCIGSIAGVIALVGQQTQALSIATVPHYASAVGQRSFPRPTRKAPTSPVPPGNRPEKRLGLGSTAGFLNAATR